MPPEWRKPGQKHQAAKFGFLKENIYLEQSNHFCFDQQLFISMPFQGPGVRSKGNYLIRLNLQKCLLGSQACWHTLLILTWRRPKQVDLWVQGQLALPSELDPGQPELQGSWLKKLTKQTCFGAIIFHTYCCAIFKCLYFPFIMETPNSFPHI